MKSFINFLSKVKQASKRFMKIFYKLLKQSRSYGKFYKLLKQIKANQASKVSRKYLVKESFTVLRYFQKKQTFYKAYTH